MLRGHVDTVTRRIIAGWAADDEIPDETIQILVLVDGRKLAQIACDAPRPDLMQAGSFGHRPHGFTYEFPQPLGDASDRRVSVRYARTGNLLNRGDAVIQRDNSVVIRTSRASPGDTEPEQFPMPRDPRSIFETLVLYDENGGLYELLSRIQFSVEKPRHIHYSVFGRYPEADPRLLQLAGIDQINGYSPRDHMNELLLSQEFQKDIVPLFLNAFPEKKRIVFIHVPKCAGTDLSVNLMKRFPSMHQTIMEENWVPKESLFRQIARLVIHNKFFDNIFLCGHSSLDYYVSRGLIRPIDRVFTIVRQPVEIVISHVNYILTRMTRDLAARKIGPDTKEWMDILGVSTLPGDMPPGLVQRLCNSIINSAQLMKPNSMCSWLGGADAESAIQQLVNYNVEITTVDEYSRWLQQCWAIKTDTRMNRSDSFVSLQSLTPADISRIQEIFAEDAKLYAIINLALDRSGSSSIRGEELRGVA